MEKKERLSKVLGVLELNKYASINELAAIYKCSPSTIRRDLEDLKSLGKVTLVSGGAVSNSSGFFTEPTYAEKLTGMKEEKTRIALSAASHITPGMTIFIDSGTTCRELIPHLTNIPDLDVITNDIASAADLSRTDIKITIVGGNLRNGYFSVGGYYAEKMMDDFHADIAFMGMDAIDPTRGCMIANIDEVGIKRKAIDHSAKTIVLCDHTKFNLRTTITVCPLSSIDLFITSDLLDEKSQEVYLSKCNIQYISE